MNDHNGCADGCSHPEHHAGVHVPSKVLDFEDARRLYLDGLTTQMDVRRLTRIEVMAIVEGQIYDTLIAGTIPELTMMVGDMPEGLERDNSALFIEIAKEFAAGMRRDIQRIMSIHNRTVRDTVHLPLSIIQGGQT